MGEWQPIETAPKNGTLCQLQFRDRFGSYDAPKCEYFLHDDGYWYLIQPPTRVNENPTHWRISDGS